MQHLHVRVLLLFPVVLDLSFSLHVSKITSFFKRPSTSNMSAGGNEELKSLKNKGLKSGSNRDNTVYENTSAMAEGLNHQSELNS